MRDGFAGFIGHNEINDIGLLGRLGKQLLQLKSAPLPAHHPGAGAGLKGPDQGRAFFQQEMDTFFFLAVDVFNGNKNNDRTAPINTQGGTPVQNFLFFERVNIPNSQSKSGATIRLPVSPFAGLSVKRLK